MFETIIYKTFNVILLIVILYYVVKKSEKNFIKYSFTAYIISIIIWICSEILRLFPNLLKIYGNIFIIVILIPVIYIPVSFLNFSIVFSKTKFSKKYLLLLIIPTISFGVLCTNSIHNLFFKNSNMNIENTYNLNTFGYYALYIHTPFSYLCILVGMIMLIYFTIKNAGFFSKQSILIVIGSIFPLISSIINSFFITIPAVSEGDGFFITAICIFFAIFKFDFLRVLPIATQTIVDNIDYSYIVIDKSHNIVDFNKPFQTTFSSILNYKRKNNFLNCLENSSMDKTIFEKTLIEVGETYQKKRFRYTLNFENTETNYSIDITPIKDVCFVIMFKDITEDLKNEQRINNLERFVSMGHLIGGIAHNLKGPILTIGGGLDILKKLANEYNESIDDESVSNNDHHEIAKDMINRITRMRPQCAYMSEVISTVKNQMTNSEITTHKFFLVDELVTRIDILLNYELKRNKCMLVKDIQIDLKTKVDGNITDLIQIVNNLLINSAQAYGEDSGEVILKLDKDKNNNLIISIADNAGGIKKEIQDKIFDKMITTKGKNGTGLGLYISHTTVTAKLHGKMWFESIHGEGTTFYISIPINTKKELLKAENELQELEKSYNT